MGGEHREKDMVLLAQLCALDIFRNGVPLCKVLPLRVIGMLLAILVCYWRYRYVFKTLWRYQSDLLKRYGSRVLFTA